MTEDQAERIANSLEQIAFCFQQEEARRQEWIDKQEQEKSIRVQLSDIPVPVQENSLDETMKLAGKMFKKMLGETE